MSQKLDEKKPLEDTTEEYNSDGSSRVSSLRRRLSESSEGSLYDDEKGRLEISASEPGLPPPPPYEAVSEDSMVGQEFGMYYSSGLRRALYVTKSHPKSTADKALKVPLYYVEVSELTRGKPDITLHGMPAGAELGPTTELSSIPRNGPVLAIARLPKLSRSIHIGIGNPADYVASSSTGSSSSSRAGEQNLTWIEAKNPNMLSHKEFLFRFQHPGLPAMKEYAWRRTHDASHGVEGGAFVRAIMLYNYVLVDTSSGENLAVFLENRFKSWNKRGKLRVLKELEPEFWLVVLTSFVSLHEKMRRSSGGGGGGG